MSAPEFPALDPPPDRAFALNHLPVRAADSTSTVRRWSCACGREAIYKDYWWGSMLREACTRPGVRR